MKEKNITTPQTSNEPADKGLANASCSPLDKVKRYLDNLTDDELDKLAQQAGKDLEKASQECNNTEWHDACFSAVIMLSDEKKRRAS